MMLRRFAPYFILLLLTLLFFWKLAFTDMILARGDTFSYFYPYRELRNEALREGRLPLWTPDIFMGAPLLADPQVAAFYLPDWLTVPFSAPEGVKISILLHTLWAGIGAYLLFQKTMTPSLSTGRVGVGFPALTAAIAFAFSGFSGAHVEQINQLEGLAWMPWLFLLLHQMISSTQYTVLSSQLLNATTESSNRPKRRVFYLLLFSAALAMQFFSGHTQTVFITGAGLAIYALVWGLLQVRQVSVNSTGLRTRYSVSLQRVVIPMLILAGGVMLALVLTVPQLLPALELTGMSNRGGSGFNAQQATAFSLPLSYIGRALLPSYDGLLFTEYVGYIGVIALGLAIYGVLTPTPSQPHPPHPATSVHSGEEQTRFSPRIVWIVMGAVGLFFAFGRYNPVYFLLADLPGFNLFRVPARWLALFSLAAAMLAGYGMQSLLQPHPPTPSPNEPPSQGAARRGSHWRIAAVIAPIMILMFAAWRFGILPDDITGGTGTPTTITLVLWAAALTILILTLLARSFLSTQHSALSTHYSLLITVFTALELFAASFILPYNDLVPRDVYEGQRFTESQLLAYRDGQTPPGRVLSISGLFFDPGDKNTLQARFDRAGMDAQAQHTAFTAVKKQEMLFPNLSLAWGIPTVDGYGGGILPTMYYTQFTSLLLPPDVQRTIDGRLGEMLAKDECRGACIPKLEYLLWMDVRYLITDKVYDVWHDGVAYDTAFVTQAENKIAFRNYDITFEATELRILFSGEESPDLWNGPGEEAVTRKESVGTVENFKVVRYTFEQPETVEYLSLTTNPEKSVSIYAATLVDRRTGDFVPIFSVVSGLPRLLSSDVKVYGVHPLGRAVLARNIIPQPDTWQGSEDALVFLETYFILAPDIVIHGDVLPDDRTDVPGFTAPVFRRYEPTYIEIQIDTLRDTYLLLKDAWYPGWKATVNGEPAQVYRANVMFRAVKIPAGESIVEFYFQPDLWIAALIFGGTAWLLWLIVVGWCWRRRTYQGSN